MFYIVRLFIYNAEAEQKAEPEKSILQRQFSIMIKGFGMALRPSMFFRSLVPGYGICMLIYLNGC
jgi:putative membrane protein